MFKNVIFLGVFLLSISILSSCQRDRYQSESEKESTEKPEKDLLQRNLKETEEDIENLFEGYEDGKKVDVVDHQDLKALLPQRVEGMDRSNYEGEKAGFLGLKFSTSSAEYKKDGRSVEVSLIDGGGFALLAQKFKEEFDIESDEEWENDEGYKRNTKINGHPAMEEYHYKDQRGSIVVWISDRFLVAVEVDGMKESDLKRTFKKINIKRLERWAS